MRLVRHVNSTFKVSYDPIFLLSSMEAADLNRHHQIRIGYSMIEDFVIKYAWSAVGIFISAEPNFALIILHDRLAICSSPFQSFSATLYRPPLRDLLRLPLQSPTMRKLTPTKWPSERRTTSPTDDYCWRWQMQAAA